MESREFLGRPTYLTHQGNLLSWAAFGGDKLLIIVLGVHAQVVRDCWNKANIRGANSRAAKIHSVTGAEQMSPLALLAQSSRHGKIKSPERCGDRRPRKYSSQGLCGRFPKKSAEFRNAFSPSKS